MYNFFKFGEYAFAMMQGKGWGSHTVAREVKYLKNKIRNRPNLAIDIGGNIGDYTAELLKVYPDMNIHVFEPSKFNFEKLSNRFHNLDNVFLNNLAVSREDGSAELFSEKEGSGMASMTKRRLAHMGINNNLKEAITTIKFENYWESTLKKEIIDIVKIDVEGHELDVLHGFGSALHSTRLIQFEFGGCNLDTKTTFQDFWYFLIENKFDIYRITPFGLHNLKNYSESDEFYQTTNFLCINQRL